MSKSSTTSEKHLCRTCLKPKEPLVEEGGLLFCQDCLKSYKELMQWMKDAA